VVWFMAVLMFVHGLIHLMGGLNELGLARIQGLSGKTLIALPNYAQMALGVSWFVPVVLFILCAVALVLRLPWWKPATLCALLVSQALIVIWWPDAKFGTIPNALILLGLFFL